MSDPLDDDSAVIAPQGEPPAAASAPPPAERRPSGAGLALALLLAVLAAAAAGYAAWRVLLIERGRDNEAAALRQQLEAIDARLTDTERRAARSNELATTLREELTQSEQLGDRLRQDLLAMADRSARVESLLAEIARDRGSARQQLALADTGLLLAQADARLRLFGDRDGAVAALALAERTLAEAGPERAGLRAAVAQARTELDADERPSASALLAELDGIAGDLDGLAIRIERDRDADFVAADDGWWARQFARLDSLISIRHASDPELAVAPSKEAVRLALTRARLAALEQNPDALPAALAAARASLIACCEAQAVQPLVARLDHLLAIDWRAPLPDLAALRRRVDDHAQIDQLPVPAVPAADAASGDEAGLPGEDNR